MRKGQATLDYILIIGIVAAAIIAMLVYISRGLQGKIRANANQLSAEQYAPGKTNISNNETKTQFSTESFGSYTTVKYGNLNEPNLNLEAKIKEFEVKEAEVKKLSLEWEKLAADEGKAAARATEAKNYNWQPPKPGLAEKAAELKKAYGELTAINKEIEELVKKDKERAERTPDVTSPSISENRESGTVSTTKHTDEALGNL